MSYERIEVNMEKLKSMLIFDKYIVNKIEFIINEKYDSDEKPNVQFSISKEVNKVENKMKVTLDVRIFEDAQKNNYPFEMNIKLTGFFIVENETKINLEPNAIAILYPYVRAIVSTYTACANVNSLILPPINVNALFEKES